MIKFLYGNSTEKKTLKLFQSIKNDTEQGIHTFLIIPEQDVLRFEKLTLENLPASSQLNLEVVSFSRLYNRICREYGGLSYSYLTDPIRYLMMWKTLRELKDNLEILNIEKKNNIVMEDLLISCINELKVNGISAEDLEDAAMEIDSASHELSNKLNDIAQIYLYFDESIKEKYSDASDDMSRLYKAIEEHDFFRNTNVYIDSFTSFTPVQHKIIENIFKKADNTTVTLPISKEDMNSIEYASVNRSVTRLLRSARVKEEPICEEVSDGASYRTEALSYLVDNLWKLDVSKDTSREIPTNFNESIVLELCDNPYSEAEAVSAHIRKLLSEGARCRDIAIIVRDTERYRGIIDQSLRKSEIPFYLSESIDISSTAAVKFIISALRVKLYNWQRKDVISHIKTGLCNIKKNEGHLFEEYVNTWSINGERFLEPLWNMNPDGITDKISKRGSNILTAANNVRKALVPALQKFFTELDAAETVDKMCRALYNYLVESRLETNLTSLAKKMEEHGDYKSAKEVSALYGVILNTLADIGIALEDQKANTSDFISILLSVFSKTSISTIPTSIDEVTIGSANMLRTSSPKYVFVLGLNEGIFPASIKDAGLFSSADRALMSQSGLELDSNADILSSDELMFVKRAFSAPQKKLYALAHKSEIDGSECFLSLAFTRIQNLFNIEKPHEYKEDDFLYLISAPKNAAMNLKSINNIQTAKTLRKALAPHIQGIENYSKDNVKTKECHVSPGSLDSKVDQEIYFTPSSFEKYAKCPFDYFCNNALKLRRKYNADFSTNVIGTFIHFVLENVIKAYIPEGKKAEIPTDEEINKIIEDTVNNYLNIICPPYLVSSKRLSHLYARLKRLSFILAKNIIREFSDSDFYPAFFELKLNGKNDAPSPLVFKLSDKTKVTISGTVDRIDLYKKEKSVYVRVVDYKTGSKVFSLDDLEYGMNLQMLLYLFTICKTTSDNFKEAIGLPEGGTMEYAGIVYLSSNIGTITSSTFQDTENVEDQAENKLQRNGLILNDLEILSAMSNSHNAKMLMGAKQVVDKEEKKAKKKKGVTEQPLEEDKPAVFEGKALVSKDDFETIFEDLKDTIIKFASKLHNGDISAKPLVQEKSPCEYCEHKPICRNVQKVRR